jgi:hypothetical protein
VTNPLDGLAVDAEPDAPPFEFTLGDRTGTIRRRTFGDVRAASHAADTLGRVMTLIERCGDATAIDLLDSMTEDGALAVWTAYEKHFGGGPGK